MSRLAVTTDVINADRGYRVWSSDEPDMVEDGESIGYIYKCYAREYGRPMSKVYVTTADNRDIPIGWVFQKRERYQDTGESYLQETWVSVYDADEVGDVSGLWPRPKLKLTPHDISKR